MKKITKSPAILAGLLFACCYTTRAQEYKLDQEALAAQAAPNPSKSRREASWNVPRISPRLASKLASSDTVSVMIVLRNQPQREIVERVEGALALYRGLAEEEYARLLKQPATASLQLRQARQRVDEIVLEGRRRAMDEIEQEIGLEQKLKMTQLEAAGASRLTRFLTHNMIAAEVPVRLLESLAADPDIAEVFPLELKRLATVSNESIDVNVGVLGVANWWNTGFNGAGQSVVVLDTGIRSNHIAFRGKEVVARSFLGQIRNHPCFADNAGSSEDAHGHGTHVAGIIAGAGEQFVSAFQGTAPGVSKIFSLKTGARFNGSEECGDNAIDTADVFKAIEWAVSNTPAKVYNMSFGGSTEDDDSGSARVIDHLASVYGLTIVVAAGNDGHLGMPAIGDTGINYNGITVANWDTRGTLSKQDDMVSPRSSLGPTPGGRYKPDVAAPGTNILSAGHEANNQLVRMSGTSMAAPKVAGLAAILHQAGITNPAAVKALLINTSDHAGWRQDRGWGLVNMETARRQMFVFNGEVEPAGRRGFTLYRGRATGTLYATLAWNRHVRETGVAFHDLDLYAYDAEGRQIAVSESADQNVEQVGFRSEGEVVLKVRAFNESFAPGIARDKFALAISQDGFLPAQGPVLESRCTSTATAFDKGAQFNLTCTVTNKGDIAGADGRVELNWRGGQGGPSATYARIAPGQAVTQSYRVTAPSAAGSYALQFTGTVSAVGESVNSGTLFQFTVR